MPDLTKVIDDQMNMFEEMCRLTGLELRALAAREWVEVERLEEARSSLFKKIVFEGEGLLPKAAAEVAYEKKFAALKAKAAELAEMDKVLSGMATVERDEVVDELQMLGKKMRALKVYKPGYEGAVYIDNRT